MRIKPNFWTGNDRICWLCVLMKEFIGVESLEYAPVIMSGMTSVYDAPILEPAKQAIFNLRQMSLSYVTKNSIEYAVALYNDHHYRNRTQGVYEIDPETLQFSQPDFLEHPSITKAREILAAPMDYKFHGRQVANPRQQMAVALGKDATSSRLPIDPITAPLAERQTHNIDRIPRGAISIPLAELRHIAEDMDRKDREHPERRSGNWSDRLNNFVVKVPRNRGLVQENETIELSGIKHLIGLPGAGKTTILMISAVWLGRNGYKVMLVFPSIEVSRQYMAELKFHGIKVGMLVGQNPVTKRTHGDRIAETIAASGGQGGFAHTLDGADSFAFNCLLPAYSPAETSLWGFGHAPCSNILQSSSPGKTKQYLCPVWTMCGRNKAPRDLIDADIWVGHIRSMDTTVPYQAIDEEIRYFELMARTFDLVIFDEADMVQSNLDSYGLAKLNLSGADDSIHRTILEQVHNPLSRNKTYLLADRTLELYSRNMAEFGNHNTSLASLLQNIHPRLRKRFEGQLLTASRIITEILEGFEKDKYYYQRDIASTAEIKTGFTKIHALTNFWRTAADSAFYDRTNTQTPQKEFKKNLCSQALGIEIDNLEDAWDKLIKLLRRYLAENIIKKRDDIVENIAELFLNICFPGKEPPHLTPDVIPLLIAITFVISGYRRTVPETRTMVAEGLIKDSILNPPISDQLRRFTPENLIGSSLSGVKYSFSDARTNRPNSSNVTLTHITFIGAPRMLMHRFNRLLNADGRKDAPAILMTSATSYLEASPAYHIDVYPNYLLKPKPRAKKQLIEPSQYCFLCLKDKERNNEPLRYSGAGELRNRNLLKMVDRLVEDSDRSEIKKVIKYFDVRHNIHRKAAFVVNGYQQVRDIKQHLDRNYPEIGKRTKAVVNYLQEGEKPADYVTTSQCEALGDDENCELIIFPMLAIGRGVNIVFTKGARERDAAIGAIYFLTRPHPTLDDTQLLYSLAGRATQRFDRHKFDPKQGLAEIYYAWNDARSDVYRNVKRLLQEPLMASKLGEELFKPFTANLMVAILQTIGRGMRNACPVSVYFVDAAWVPQSARGKPDSPRDSMLVQMRLILEECVQHEDPVIQEIYEELYLAFLEPLRRIKNVKYPANLFQSSDSVYEDDGFEDDDALYDM